MGLPATLMTARPVPYALPGGRLFCTFLRRLEIQLSYITGFQATLISKGGGGLWAIVISVVSKGGTPSFLGMS